MQTLYYGGSIRPIRGGPDRVEALIVEDGRISFCGALEDARALLCGQHVRRVDLQGRALLPAFIDAHSHFSKAVQYSTMADLSNCHSFDEIAHTLSVFQKTHPLSPDEVLWGFGYDENTLKEHTHPTCMLLDHACDGAPVLIVQASNHMAVASSALLHLAGIDAHTPDPPGGRFGRMPGSKAPDGYAEEPPALAPLYQAAMARTHIDLHRQIGAMQRVYLEQGITTVQDGAATFQDVCDMTALAEDGLLDLDVIAYPARSPDIDEIFSKFAAYDGCYHGHYKLGGCKMLLDGSPQGGTAWLTAPYADGSGSCGQPALTDAEALAFTRWSINHGHQLLAHCNGDAAADQFLHCYRQALCQSHFLAKGALRPVMVHCQTVRPDQLAQMMPLGMIPSFFVAHIWYWGDVHWHRLGPRRACRISPLRTALRLGLPFTLHQDTPVLRPNMLETVWCAANRVTSSGRQFDLDERIPVYEALRAVTCNAAYSYFEEEEKGALVPGMRADLVLLDRDPLAVPRTEVRRVRVLETIKDGRTLYRAGCPGLC